MHKLFPILLIGTLSMFFAEVFSGASQTWFIDGWGILVTFPLYLAHLLFFLTIALRTKRTSLTQLYMFGVLFALYEAWITKVLWAGYFDQAGPSLGTFLGLGIAEFPILTFFWHPIMSFIVPILVFELLTGMTLDGHLSILEKGRRKTLTIALFLILISSFIANGNGFDHVSANLSVVGSLLLIAILAKNVKNISITDIIPKKKGFALLSIYLFLLYVLTFIFLLPERIPTTIIPYLSIFAFYAIAIILLARSKRTSVSIIETSYVDVYSKRNITLFAVVLMIGVNVACSIPQISMGTLMLTYMLLNGVGIIMFFTVIRRTIK